MYFFLFSIVKRVFIQCKNNILIEQRRCSLGNLLSVLKKIWYSLKCCSSFNATFCFDRCCEMSTHAHCIGLEGCSNWCWQQSTHSCDSPFETLTLKKRFSYENQLWIILKWIILRNCKFDYISVRLSRKHAVKKGGEQKKRTM